MEDSKKKKIKADVNNIETDVKDGSIKKRLALFRILQVLKKYSSKDEPILQEVIIDKLETDHRFSLERKAVGRGLKDLMDAGFNIKVSSRKGYYIDEGVADTVVEEGNEPFPGFDFYDHELFFLLSCISGSSDISDAKAIELGNKIANMGNKAFRKAAKKRFIRKITSDQSDYYIASENMKTLNIAIETYKEVSFKYHSYKLNKKNVYTYEIIRDEDLFEDVRLRPLDLVFAGGKSFLIGKKPESNDLLVYRLDRITNLVMLSRSFPCATIEDKEALANFKNSHPFMEGGNVTKVTLKVSPEILSDVADSFGSEIAFQGRTGAFIHLSVNASEDEIIGWALKNSGKAEVMEPYELRNKIRNLIDDAQKKYVRFDRIIRSERDNNERDFISRFDRINRAVDNNMHQLDNKNYKSVFLENNNLRNVSFLGNYNSLIDLTIIKNPVNYLPLRSCRLKRLELTQTGIERVTFDRVLIDLEDLILFDNPINDYSFLYNLRKLKRIMIDPKTAEKIDIEKIRRLNQGVKVFVEEKHWREKLKALTIPDPFGNNKWLTEEELRGKEEFKEKTNKTIKNLTEEQAHLFKFEHRERNSRNINLRNHPLKTVAFGEYVQGNSGNYVPSPVEWLVLEENDNDMLLLSKAALEAGSMCNAPGGNPATWENSDLRKWLNGEFLKETFSKKERSMLVENALITESVNEEGTKALSKTFDHVYLLSKTEYASKLRRLIDQCELTSYAEANSPAELYREGIDLYKPFYCGWWLRTSDNSNFDVGGSSLEDKSVPATENAIGVRPVIRVKKTKELLSKVRDVKPEKDFSPEDFDFNVYLERRYQRGKAMFYMGAYQKAQKYFYGLDYKDSGLLFNKSRNAYTVTAYSEALESIENEEYEHGYQILKELGYDAVIIENKYQRALKLIESDDKLAAARLLIDLNFKESRILLADAEHDILKDANPGDNVVLGSYLLKKDSKTPGEKQALEWKVLAKEGKKMLLETACYINAGPFDDTDEKNTAWKSCTLRKWLNVTFYDEAFLFLEHHLINRTAVFTNVGSQKEVTLDRLFLLSDSQVQKYADVEETNAMPDTGSVVTLDENGGIHLKVNGTDDPSAFVRPAMWIEV